MFMLKKQMLIFGNKIAPTRWLAAPSPQLSQHRTSASGLHLGIHKQDFLHCGFVLYWVNILRNHTDPDWEHWSQAINLFYTGWSSRDGDVHRGSHMLSYSLQAAKAHRSPPQGHHRL